AAALMATVSLRDEVTTVLQDLIRLDTVNPPGNETRAAEYLRSYLEGSGLPCELYARIPERASLVARIPGRGEGPSLLFLSHTDTVLADAAEWKVDPWSGELRDGEVWGRGALDMKGEVAASAVAIASLAREGFEPAGDLIFVAAADEEVGVGYGLPWLCEEHLEAVRADYALNEGGGERIELAGRALYLCSTAEKMSSPFRLRVHGRAGHASMPGIADNALTKAAPLIERLAAYRPELRLEEEADALVQTIAGQKLGAEEALALARELDPEAAVVPICVAGFTDSHWLRESFGTVVYGFFPMRTMDARLASRLIHSADERAHVKDLELGVECFRHVARAVCG